MNLINCIIYFWSQELLEAANRWTDNVYTLRSWCVKKFNVDQNELNKQFEIPEDLDYIIS